MFTTRPELTGTFGMVTSTHWIASAVGMSILERGGNAVDAAVATGFVLQIVEPHLNGPGGEVPIIVGDPSGPVEVYAGQGWTPAAATIDNYRSMGLDRVPGSGLLAAVVPGAFGAWTLLLERRGTMTLRDVLAPAISYAANGFPLLERVVGTIGVVEELFRSHWPTSAVQYLPGGRLPQPGALMRNEALAACYTRILEEAESRAPSRERQLEVARDVFYRGFVAEEIVRWSSSNAVMDSSRQPHAGLFERSDLAEWEPSIEQSVSTDFLQHRVHKTAAWGQGPVFLQQLAILEPDKLVAAGVGSADWVHSIAEAAKLAFADREAWYADPTFTDVPLSELLSERYNRERRQLIDVTASLELRPGSPGGRLPLLPDAATALAAPPSVGAAGTGEPTNFDTGDSRGDTCHLDVVDHNGLMVSATPSGGWLQSSPIIPALGFSLGSRAQMLWLEPGLPSSLAGRKRPRTTLSPTLVTRDDRPVLAFGTPGGDQQDQWSLQFFLAHVLGGLNLQAAIDTPTFHTLSFPGSFEPRIWIPGRLVVESRLGNDVIDNLRLRGHDIEVVGEWALGRVTAVAHDPKQRTLSGAASARSMQAYAIGR